MSFAVWPCEHFQTYHLYSDHRHSYHISLIGSVLVTSMTRKVGDKGGTVLEWRRVVQRAGHTRKVGDKVKREVIRGKRR